MPDEEPIPDPILQRLIAKPEELKEQSRKLNLKVEELDRLVKAAAARSGR